MTEHQDSATESIPERIRVRQVNLDNLPALGLGATLLGVGAGSYPHHELMLAARCIRASGPVVVKQLDELQDTDWVAVVVIAGAPITACERMIDVEHMARPMQVLERHLQVRCAAVMQGEACDLNSLVPLLVASRQSLPMIDADLVGRSLPQLEMTSFGIAGELLSPFAISDLRGIDVIVEGASAGKLEKLCRGVCNEFGSMASTCSIQPAHVLKRLAIRGTMSRSVMIGRIIAEARHTGDPIKCLLEATHGLHIIAGKIVDVEATTSGAFVWGKVVIQETGSARTVEISIKNEYLAAREYGRFIAVTPDLICVLETDSAEPIGTDALRFGMRVSVVVLPAPKQFLTPAGLAIAGPRAFGFDTDYFPAHGASL